jgi:hypothetical protein
MAIDTSQAADVAAEVDHPRRCTGDTWWRMSGARLGRRLRRPAPDGFTAAENEFPWVPRAVRGESAARVGAGRVVRSWPWRGGDRSRPRVGLPWWGRHAMTATHRSPIVPIEASGSAGQRIEIGGTLEHVLVLAYS